MSAPSVDFITFCYHKDIERLAVPGELKSRIDSHRFPFAKKIMVRQNIRGQFDDIHFPDVDQEVETEEYPDVLERFGFDISKEQKADDMTHGPSALHYWKWHVINHLTGLLVSKADYIVFSDNDCRIVASPGQSWVEKSVEILTQHRSVLLVSPGEGGSTAEARLPGDVRLTQNNSQQLFCIERKRFLEEVDLAIPWDWEFLAPGEPFQEYYYMLEGRIWRYMHHNGLYRAILPETWKYWHDQW